MNKKEVQARVLQNGKPLELKNFNWDEKTNTFSTDESHLVLDFNNRPGITFKTGHNCTFGAGMHCVFNTGSHCVFNTGSHCMFKTENYCTFYTGHYCMFKTGNYCTFKTASECTFDTENSCMFDVFHDGIFVNNNNDSTVIIRYDGKYKVYELNKLSKALLRIDLEEIIEKPIKECELIDRSIMVKLSTEKLVDGISVYKAQYFRDYFNDDNNDKKVYIAKDGEYNAHGTDIKDAIKNVIFKKQYNLGAEVNAKRVVESGIVTMQDYRLLTGSCEAGIKRHLDENNIAYDTVMSIKDTIKFIENTSAYRKEIFIKNLKKVGWKDNV